MTRFEEVEYLRENISESDLWGQLAEECAELSQAALKMQREVNGTNPTRKTKAEWIDNVQEELADIHLCVNLLGIEDRDQEFWDHKIPRWYDIIKAVKRRMG